MKIYLETVPALVLFCLSILVAPASAAAAQKPPAKTHPSIQVRHPDYNFGTSVQGATIEHAFTVRNTGKEPLKIEHVKVA